MRKGVRQQCPDPLVFIPDELDKGAIPAGKTCSHSGRLFAGIIFKSFFFFITLK